MYTALYRALRPEVFDEILGQEHIVRILKNQIETDTVSHAYLFCGTRGTGKTTTARILAKAVNCLNEGTRPCGHCQNCMSIKDGNFMDVVEIDAASNNGVDNIRELKESVKYPPAIGRKKVYIVDEVHMLSAGAFNALLKTLEEPPENVMFILATTEPQKLPATILSRCMRLDFKRVPQNILAESMKKICTDRGVNISDGAVRLLSNCADGSVRDGLSVLDQVLAGGEKDISRERVLEYIGAAGEDFFIELTELVQLHKVSEALLLLNDALSDGKDVKQMMKDWTAHYRNLLITKFIKNPEDMLNMSAENIQRISEQTMHISLDEINNAIIKLSKTINDARWSTQPRILLELALVAIATDLIDEQATPKNVRRVTTAQTPQAYTPISSPIKSATSDIAREKEDTLEKANLLSNRDSELETIWHSVFESGESTNPSINVIRTGAVLESMDEVNFHVLAKNRFAKRYLDENKEMLEDLMERQIGRRLKMVYRCVEDDTYQQESLKERQSLEEAARMAAETFGIDIEIKN